MTLKKKNLSEHQRPLVAEAEKIKIGIVVSEWNPEITHALSDAAVDTLIKYGVRADNISLHDVPGSFELPLAAALLCETDTLHAVICIGCVIQGETRHFEFICQAVSQGITRVGLDYAMPVIFGVLTTDTMEQARDRAGGKHGNKGVEAAVAALKMLGLMQDIYQQTDPDQLFFEPL